jgi:hypothetical protein
MSARESLLDGLELVDLSQFDAGAWASNALLQSRNAYGRCAQLGGSKPQRGVMCESTQGHPIPASGFERYESFGIVAPRAAIRADSEDSKLAIPRSPTIGRHRPAFGKHPTTSLGR